MKRITAFFLAIGFLAGFAAADVRLDVKTRFLNKVNSVGIKYGAIHYLEQEGYNVVETGEDRCLWLEDFRETQKGPNLYECRLRVVVTMPSLLSHKRALSEREVVFSYSHELELLSTDDSFWKLIREKVKGIKEREMERAYFGGKAIARVVKEMLGAAPVKLEKL